MAFLTRVFAGLIRERENQPTTQMQKNLFAAQKD
jgi:hypothetical protein